MVSIFADERDRGKGEFLWTLRCGPQFEGSAVPPSHFSSCLSYRRDTGAEALGAGTCQIS